MTPAHSNANLRAMITGVLPEERFAEVRSVIKATFS
jgi:hypothetical protein